MGVLHVLQDVTAVVMERTQALQAAEVQLAEAQSLQREAEEDFRRTQEQAGRLKVMCKDQFEKLHQCAL
jgi:hypothetical protein